MVIQEQRAVLEHVVEQHAEEAAFLWTLRDAATDAPHYKGHQLGRLDARVEAHVDGLRVAGEAGWRIALEQLERRCEKGELFAAGVMALESGDLKRIEPLVAMAAESEPAIRRGLIGAIAWCPPVLLAGTVRLWDGSQEGFERYLALCACSVHRAGAGTRLAHRLEDEVPLVRARARRLAGELGRQEFVGSCVSQIDDPCEHAGFWAAWSAVLLGDRGAALQALSESVTAETPPRWIALEVCARALGVELSILFIDALKDVRLRHTFVVAFGHVGDPAAIPWLIQQMEHRDLARAAGESFAAMTGANLAYDDLERVAAASEPTRLEADDTNVEEDDVRQSDGLLPVPDPALVRSWWQRHGHRFKAGSRYLLGRPIEVSACRHAWKEGFQRQRRAASYELALATASASLPNWRAKP